MRSDTQLRDEANEADLRILNASEPKQGIKATGEVGKIHQVYNEQALCGYTPKYLDETDQETNCALCLSVVERIKAWKPLDPDKHDDVYTGTGKHLVNGGVHWLEKGIMLCGQRVYQQAEPVKRKIDCVVCAKFLSMRRKVK